MTIHRLEKIWIGIGLALLFVFLALVGVAAFAFGMHPPTGHALGVEPERATEVPPFDRPGLVRNADGSYDAYVVAFAFGYSPATLEIPAGATVHFYVTSTDVVHGFSIPGTNVNAMVVPGEVNHVVHTFDKPGTYLLICNEYCGAAHEMMAGTVVVR